MRLCPMAARRSRCGMSVPARRSRRGMTVPARRSRCGMTVPARRSRRGMTVPARRSRRGMTVPARRSRRGMTVIELMISATVLGIALGVPAMLLRSGSNAYAVETASTEAAEQLRTGMSRITSRLETAVSASFWPLPPVSGAALDYQRGTPFGTGPGPLETLELEITAGDPDDGLDNDADGLIDERRLVWIEDQGGPNEVRVTLVENVPEAAPGENLLNGVDDNGNGLTDEEGFWIQLEADRALVYLAIARPGPGGTVITRDVQRWVSFRN